MKALTLHDIGGPRWSAHVRDVVRARLLRKYQPQRELRRWSVMARAFLDIYRA